MWSFATPYCFIKNRTTETTERATHHYSFTHTRIHTHCSLDGTTFFTSSTP